MLAVSGVVARKGRVLVCRRSSGMFYRDSWEFPTFEIEDGETIEDSLERNFFDCFSVQVVCGGLLNVGVMEGNPSVRIFLYGVDILGKIKFVQGYSCYKWLKIKELARFRLSPACVTSIKGLEKNMAVSC